MITKIYNNLQRLLYKLYKYLSVSKYSILFRLKYFVTISIKALWYFKKKKIWNRHEGESKKYLLHLIPENTTTKSLNYLGSSKDIKTRT